MLLEKMMEESALKRHPAKAVFLGAVCVLIGFVISFMVFRGEMSVVMLFFSSLLVLPYMTLMLKKEKITGKVAGVFGRHRAFIIFYLALFGGMVVEYLFLFTILPPVIGNSAFENQLNTIVPGFQSPGGHFVNVRMGLFSEILVNNIIIVFIAIVLSLFFEVGAVFVLNYNASIAAVLYGSATRPLLWGLDGRAVPLYLNPLSLIPHTAIEIVAYIFAAVAGGILARGLSKPGKDIGNDFLVFGILAVVLVVAGALVEAVVPFLFLGS